MVRFFNRERELSILDDLYGSPTSSLVVPYGRRRVGKTKLAREFIKDKKSFYLLVEAKTEKLLLGTLRIRWREFWGSGRDWIPGMTFFR